MGVIDSPEKLLYTAAGLALAWLGSIIAKWIKESTDRVRSNVDKLAATETENRKLKESLHAHRVEMLKSGQWTQDTLPAFIKE